MKKILIGIFIGFFLVAWAGRAMAVQLCEQGRESCYEFEEIFGDVLSVHRFCERGRESCYEFEEIFGDVLSVHRFCERGRESCYKFEAFNNIKKERDQERLGAQAALKAVAKQRDESGRVNQRQVFLTFPLTDDDSKKVVLYLFNLLDRKPFMDDGRHCQEYSANTMTCW